ncbi:sensor histidine kinase [Nocardioides sp.]|uniref:sensor histidine kinase n=1 Tax=Nocardioides sp. TaxID=35761 RepID=UPI003782D80B
MTGWRAWVPDVGVGLLVLLVGLLEVANLPHYYGDDPRPAAVVVTVAVAVAAALCRHLPAGAFGLVWVLGVAQVMTGTQLLLVEVAVGAVAFGVARWGSTATVWASALSIPVAALVGVLYIDTDIYYAALDQVGFRTLVIESSRLSDSWQVTAALLGVTVLGVPWLAGLALRFSDRARRSQESQVTAEAARDQAEEIARLREQQAQLARDVHDVVGHSLAVILAQAESAQYLDDVDTQGLKRTMSNIATSARSSLDDVRQVLSSTGDASARTHEVDLESLVEGARASGQEIRSTEVGSPQPMPPELEVVAFRVLQEMLTNAIKHGRRDLPVLVERHWEGDLRIEVQNAIDPGADATSDETRPIALMTEPPEPGGQGLDGMRRRLEAVGGRLDVRRRAEPPTFTATAWVPVRPR